MDGTRFDRLTRELAGGRSRRSVVKGLIGSLAALSGAGSAAAKPKCREVGHPCEGNQSCCGGLVCIVSGPGNALRCTACPTGTIPCGNSCIPACTASDACHVAGVCNQATGACTNPAAAAGTVCTPALDACHQPSTCDGNGSCGAGGTINCNDGDPCTIDTCDPATGCVNTPVTCDDDNECTADACNPDGSCSNSPLADGTACDGGSGTCQGGQCEPTAPCLAMTCTRDAQCPDTLPLGDAGCVTIREAVGSDGHPTGGICRNSESALNCFDDGPCLAGQRCVDRVNVHDGIGLCLDAFGTCSTSTDCEPGQTCVALYPGGPDTSLPVSGPGVCVASCD